MVKQKLAVDKVLSLLQLNHLSLRLMNFQEVDADFKAQKI